MKDLLKDSEEINNYFREIGRIEGRREALIERGEFDFASPLNKFKEFLMSVPLDCPNTQRILRELHENISILLIKTAAHERSTPALRILKEDQTN